MKRTHQIVSLTIVFSVLLSCSTKKDSVINRNFHALTTKYNVLFNGQQAYEKGLKNIREKHEDNFWKRLEIEPITFDKRSIGELKFNSSPGGGFNSSNEEEKDNTSATPFDRAEEKATKAIQKHSMNIRGYEKNRQIDDAYLLLGKARYHTQRFIPAVEAFNYIIANYPKANLIYNTKVWRAKSNIRLENEKLAIESLNLLIELDKNEKNLTNLQRQETYTALAMAYEKTDTIQKVINNLATSITFVKNHQSSRNAFILGQIYAELGRKDSARAIFKKLASTRRTPEKYRIHANIELVKNMKSDSSSVGLIERFEKLIRNSDNRKYLNELYYQIGVLEEGRDSINKAKEYYLQSLESKKNTNYQKTYAYERLGNIYFKEQEYLLAGVFYDSVLQATTEEFETEKRIRRIRRKNKGLVKLRNYEETVKNSDSILKLVAMNTSERETYFKAYIEKLKEEDEIKRQRFLNTQNFGSQSGGNANNSFIGNQGKWYFYNTQSKGFGRVNFQKNWGNRKLEDNWRWSDKTTVNSQAEDEDEKETTEASNKYEIKTYLEAIPKDEVVIEQLKKDRNDALYKLGLIYKEQFKNPDLAIHNLERLSELNTDEKLKLPINYHLYQLYDKTGEKLKAGQKRNTILRNYPNSKYAQIIKEPNTKIIAEEKVNELHKKYRYVYSLYKHFEYEEVVNQVNSLSPAIDNSELIPKFALLKALSIGKLENKEAYRKALEFVAFNYADKIEGEKAKEIIELLK